MKLEAGESLFKLRLIGAHHGVVDDGTRSCLSWNGLEYNKPFVLCLAETKSDAIAKSI